MGQQRLETRRARPAREAVRDAVEKALEQELATLMASLRGLEDNLSRVNREIAATRSKISEIQADMGDKQHAQALDERCLALSKASSVGGSSRAPSQY
eukprot:NODE_2633_length_458_cov_344.322738_g2180_i0.p1 GENE.NODE_2633_length_458_cov_344.322738_g2180_i0~~NODE_2633_length_458_cov_344.322738_g2180_i0.p1  ORF type:complete len:107 (-),score=32.08 NODE_2633_length_458_cov_344.322738_g2180_i0:138-431(-)